MSSPKFTVSRKLATDLLNSGAFLFQHAEKKVKIWNFLTLVVRAPPNFRAVCKFNRIFIDMLSNDFAPFSFLIPREVRNSDAEMPSSTSSNVATYAHCLILLQTQGIRQNRNSLFSSELDEKMEFRSDLGC